MTMTPDVIEKKWWGHDDLAVTTNDAAPLVEPNIVVSIHVSRNEWFFISTSS